MTFSERFVKIAKAMPMVASLAFIVVLGWSIVRVLLNQAGLVLPLDSSQAKWTSTIGGLVLVAGIIERATEVIVMTFRDECAAGLSDAVELAAKKATAAPADPEAAGGLEKAQKTLTSYKEQTKQFALFVAFCFGLLLALAGARSLHWLLLDQKVVTGRLFLALDVIITGAMLAGGSEGIHRLANVLTSGADTLSTKIDKAAPK